MGKGHVSVILNAKISIIYNVIMELADAITSIIGMAIDVNQNEIILIHVIILHNVEISVLWI